MIVSPKKIIFVHGYGDYSSYAWPEWLAEEVKQSGFEFIKVILPDPMFPEVHDWVQAITDLKISVDENTYFIGHSLGCITIARFLATLPARQKAGGSIFVAGFSSFPAFPLINDFCVLPLDWNKVKSRAGKAFTIMSDDDKMVPLELAQEFARNIGAEIILETGQGHFKENIKKIPSLLNIILELDLERQKRI